MAEGRVDWAASMVEELRKNFLKGKTRSYEWRVGQMRRLLQMIEEKESEIMQALSHDLCKPQIESFIQEISMVKESCKLVIKELKRWMKPEKAKTGLTTFPSSAEIVSEPVGVVLVISAWNYPFGT